MPQWQEMDEGTSLVEQLQSKDPGQVVLINKFTVASPDFADEFMAVWKSVADFMENSGAISSQLHRGTGASRTFINVAVWESTAALRAALGSPEFQALTQSIPDEVTTSPHVFLPVSFTKDG